MKYGCIIILMHFCYFFMKNRSHHRWVTQPKNTRGNKRRVNTITCTQTHSGSCTCAEPHWLMRCCVRDPVAHTSPLAGHVRWLLAAQQEVAPHISLNRVTHGSSLLPLLFLSDTQTGAQLVYLLFLRRISCLVSAATTHPPSLPEQDFTAVRNPLTQQNHSTLLPTGSGGSTCTQVVKYKSRHFILLLNLLFIRGILHVLVNKIYLAAS